MLKKILIRIKNEEMFNYLTNECTSILVSALTVLSDSNSDVCGRVISNDVYEKIVSADFLIHTLALTTCNGLFLSKNELDDFFPLETNRIPLDLFYNGIIKGSDIAIDDDDLKDEYFIILNVDSTKESGLDLKEVFPIFNNGKTPKLSSKKEKKKISKSNTIVSTLNFKGNGIMFPPQALLGPKIIQYQTENKPVHGVIKKVGENYNVYVTDKRLVETNKKDRKELFGKIRKIEVPYKMSKLLDSDLDIVLGGDMKEESNVWTISFEHEDFSLSIPILFEKAIKDKLIKKEEIDKYYKLFEQYNLPEEMIKTIVSGWKDYGELNKKIPNFEEAIFIDSKKEEYVKRACAHILGNNNKFPRLRLVGHLSVGKDVLLKTLGVLFHKPMDIVTIFSDTQKEEILGSKTLDENGSIKFLPEPLITAMENGTWVVFNEINTCDSGILEVLHKVLDSEKAIIVAGYGHIKAKEGFGFFASMNPSDSNYSGTKEMNPATQSRMKTMEIKQQVELHKILAKKYPDAKKEDIQICKTLYDILNDLVINESFSESFLAVRLYEDALDSAKWIDIKSALIDVVAHGNTNNIDEIEKVEKIIATKIV